ncbi:NACHT, LRR and PYD domains-containing protein 1 homolog isoform X2 [Triplophysa rosa]|uniref:NACHT, LRR and PYD domains-containing protein 1 homolog isoform X2 n=1 Tax=Triplophysa rosa TaxID=992332 RepID=UPI0025461FE5|nr:NACHT, LRR and PYD domains-containing protein 1 homolog isoform X2 [Triplophysa rosa]
MDHNAIRAQFVDAHWATLVQRVGIAVMPIADELFSNKMLGSESYSMIKAAATNQEKMRVLVEVLHSGGNAVKSAFYSGLEKHAAFLLRDLSLNPPTAECHVESLEEYKKWIQRELKFVTEYNSLPGDHVLLSERYIQPLIIMRHREKKERTEELCFKGESFQQLISSENDAEKENNVLDALFSADSKGICPGAVILQGNSGKGKSVTAQKIMLDWASGNHGRENYDCVFHLKCKELNQISEEQSLVEILSINSNLTPDQILQILQKSPKRVLVLIDGFDELKFSFSDASNKLTARNLYKKDPPEASLTALLSGCLLPESFLLVTTRSTATDTLSGVLKKPQRLTEIIGFSEREVEEYFQKFFQAEELFRNAYESVKANETLFTACSSPVICWIICTVIRERFNDGAYVTSGLETTTSIYVDFVFILLKHHCQGLSESVPTLLKSLGQLAERGVLERQVLFDEKSVKKAVSDPAGSPFLGKFLFKKRTRQETMFSFMHLSFQEFFTALYYVLDEKEFCGKLTEWFHSELPEYHFFPVVQFLCGLCNKEVSDSLKETHNVSVPPSVQAQLEEWILHFRTKYYLRYILLCLYELHEKDFVQKAVEAWQEMDMSWDSLNRTDCWALVYCLECCPQFRSLNLNFAAEELKMLQSVLCRTPELELVVQNLADTDVSDLISALGEEKLLRALRLNSKGLSDQSVRQILHALHKQKTVGGLQIAVKNITADTALILTDFIQNTEKWEEIGLRTNTDCKNAESLCSGLRLYNTDGIFALHVVRLCSTPQKAPSLSEIILRYPHSEMSGMNLKNFLQAFHDINCLTEENAGFEQQVDSLLSHLFSFSDLSVIISAPLLTEKWASRILFLIQSCSKSLPLYVAFKAGFLSSDGAKWLPGLLMEEGIRFLQESPKYPRCTLVIEGLRCCKSTGCCSHQTDQIKEIDCNQSVTIVISRGNCTEDCSDQEST